jgi:hypothetical protein
MAAVIGDTAAGDEAMHVGVIEELLRRPHDGATVTQRRSTADRRRSVMRVLHLMMRRFMSGA